MTKYVYTGKLDELHGRIVRVVQRGSALATVAVCETGKKYLVAQKSLTPIAALEIFPQP